MTHLLTALHELPDSLELLAPVDLARRVRRRADRTRRRHHVLSTVTAAACLGLALPVVLELRAGAPVESLPGTPSTSSPSQSDRAAAGLPALGQPLTLEERADLLAAWEARAQQAGGPSQGPTTARPPVAYAHVEVLSEHVLPGYRYGVEGQQQLWLADDGTGRGRQQFTASGTRFWTESDREAAEQAGGARPQDMDEGVQVEGAARTLRNAPPDPSVLRRALRQGAGDLGDPEAFVLGGAALLLPAPSPEWGVRVVAALGWLEGVDWMRNAQLPDGREGIALVTQVEGRFGTEQRRLVLREADGQLLGTLVVRDGTLTGYAIPTEQAFVETLRSTP